MADMDFRFGGIQRLYGDRGFQKIRNSHVCVIGLGGVGSWAVEALARSGLGEITLVDFDDVCISNTNRQLPAITDNVGRLKTQVLKTRVKDINPDIKVNVIDAAYGEDTESEIFSKKYDAVVDAIDRSFTKLHLCIACKKRNIPVVVAGSAGGRFDPALIEISDLSKTREDTMLAILRKDLRRQGGFPRKGSMGVPCVYSTEKITYYQEQGTVSQERPKDFRKPLDCASGLGTATHITGSFGFALSHLAIKELLKVVTPSSVD